VKEDKAIIDIDVRDGDGIYLIINNPEAGPRAARQDVIDAIEGCGIKDVDYFIISNIFKRDELHIEECISRNTDVVHVLETMTVTVSKDKMSATAKFNPPVNKGRKLTATDIATIIEKEGIRFGVPAGLPEKLSESHDYTSVYTVATGQDLVEGADGYIKYHFNEKKKDIKPKTMEDGKVDYKNLDLIEKAVNGQVLLTFIQPVPGNNGINVHGQVAAARKVKTASVISAGKNVMESEDGSELIATEDGQIIFDGKKISVSPILEINGNIDNSTGNIDFNGSLVIKGNVLAGFSISAVGNIDILGVVEGAKIKSDHSIILSSGIQGSGVAEIVAGEDIFVKYVENSTLYSGGNIITDSIMHSKVSCGGALTLKGRNGLLVGGHTRVGGRLEAQTIGSRVATLTELEVGMDPKKLQEYRVLQEEYEAVKKGYELNDRLFVTLNTAMKRGTLPVDKKVQLLKTINMRNSLREKAEAIQDRIKDIMPYLDGEGNVIIINKVMYSGVKLLLGNAAMLVQHRIQSSKLKNTDGRIQIVPF